MITNHVAKPKPLIHLETLFMSLIHIHTFNMVYTIHLVLNRANTSRAPVQHQSIQHLHQHQHLLTPLFRALYSHALPMVRRPDASDTGVRAGDGLLELLGLLAARVAEELGLLEDFERLHVAHANGLGAPVDVVAHEDRVLGGPGRDDELDLRVGGGEFGEEGFDEAAWGERSVSIRACRGCEGRLEGGRDEEGRGKEYVVADGLEIFGGCRYG